MKEKLEYRRDHDLKNEYGKFITGKYGYKRNRYSSKISKWIKLGLATNGYLNYRDDPDVQEFLDAVGKIPYTQNSKGSDNDVDQVEKLEQKMDKMKRKLISYRFSWYKLS